MATFNHSPVFSINQIVTFKGKTCLIQDIQKILGFHQYEVVDIDTGAVMISMGYQMTSCEDVYHALLPDFLDVEMPEIEIPMPEIEIPTPAPAEKKPTPQENVNNSGRWAKMSEADLNALAENRHSAYTGNQTRWAVRAFRGLFLTLSTCLICAYFGI